jgi:hypothetical protein
LELYLALKNDAWLSDEDPDIEGISQGNAVLPLYMLVERKMNATWGINDYFGADPPKKRQIHVLVVVPEGAVHSIAPTISVTNLLQQGGGNITLVKLLVAN